MRFMKAGLWFVAVLLAIASAASAQSTTGTISGRVTDSQDLPIPGVTVVATSPNLQGTRETVTSENGDYILTLLPSGTYTVDVRAERIQRRRSAPSALRPHRSCRSRSIMGPAAVSETVKVVGRSRPTC